MQMNTDQKLYNSLLARHSTRRYQAKLVSDDELLQVRQLSATIEALDKDNKFEIKVYQYQPETTKGKALGVYGHIMKPPYFFAPIITGTNNALVDLGYRTQQMVMNLWNEGFGSCYVGCAHRQNHVRQLMGISDQFRIISFVIFGRPDKNKSLRLYQRISKLFTRSKDRLPYEKLFLGNQSTEKLLRDPVMKKILDAGRFAPSATNAQPWRFDTLDGHFIIYAHHKKIANLYDLEQGYAQHDTGICMANMSLAAKALGAEIHWQWASKDMIIQMPKGTDLPIAFFSLDGLRRF